MKKHSVLIYGHPTSLSMEEEFWDELKKIASEKNISLANLIREIDSNRTGNLSSALRVFVLKQMQEKIPENNETL